MCAEQALTRGVGGVVAKPKMAAPGQSHQVSFLCGWLRPASLMSASPFFSETRSSRPQTKLTTAKGSNDADHGNNPTLWQSAEILAAQ